MQVVHLILDHFKFLASVAIGGYLVVAFFERKILTIGHFSEAFLLVCKFENSGLRE